MCVYIASHSVHLHNRSSQSTSLGRIFPFRVMENRLRQTRVRDEEHTSAVAAAAFAIYSLYLRSLKEAPISSLRSIAIRQDSDPNYARENAFSVRPSPQNQTTPIPPPQQNDFKTRAHVWEKANLQKIHKRCEKIKSKILFWETEQKEQAKLHLERKNLMEPTTRAIEQQRYQNKIARIDMIARTARAQLEDKRRKEESQVRETAKQIRETGRVPVKCFCCFIF